MAAPPFDFSAYLKQADQTASDQEHQARDLLRELVFERAERDPQFKKALVQDPERVVREEARKIPTQGGGQAVEEVAQKMRTLTVQEVAQEARQRFSTAIIGASETQVTELVFGTLANVRTSFRRTLLLSQWLFLTGLALTVASFLVAVFGEKDLIAGIFGGGGVLTLISHAVMNPLDRIRNAAANLVQVQIAYVSYYKQLSMLGGQDGHAMSIDDAVKYSTELRKGAVETIAAVQSIVEKTAPYDVRSTSTNGAGRRTSEEQAPADSD
jgi:hypothetical protein